MVNGYQAGRQTGSACKAVGKEQGPSQWSGNLVPRGETGQRRTGLSPNESQENWKCTRQESREQKPKQTSGLGLGSKTGKLFIKVTVDSEQTFRKKSIQVQTSGQG